MKRKAVDIEIPDEFPDEAEAEPSFPICPLGLPQVGRACLGFYERDPGYLQLRFGALDNEGLCDIVLEEGPEQIAVRVVLCSKKDEPVLYHGLAEERAHVDLERPLDGRQVTDLETGLPVPFYVPTYLDGRRTEAPGYYTHETEALAGRELQPKDDEHDVPRRGALSQTRTCGF